MACLSSQCRPRGLGQQPGLPPGEGPSSLPDFMGLSSRKVTDGSELTTEAEVWTPPTTWASLAWRHLGKLSFKPYLLPTFLLPPYSFLENIPVLIYAYSKSTPLEGQLGCKALEAVV